MEDPLNGCNAASSAAMTVLSADRPCTDPKDDLFGHAPFARHLAKSIRCHRGGDGLVIALHGPWGSGKTTILNYVCHYLEAEKSEDADPPVVVHFNPWWFSGREDLAQTFLQQLQAALPAKNSKLKRVGGLLGEYGEDIGGAVDLSGVTGGFGRMAGRILGRTFKRTPRDVPALKARIADELREAKVRILVIIDDIDRLDHDEVRQLFTVIKALADFPFVTYLLAFDREAAVQSLEQDSGLPGARYLEKIIQVPFEIPLIDRSALQRALCARLDTVLGHSSGIARDPRWVEVYDYGIMPLIQVPRDVVRFINAISMTFPAVANEVNPIDFFAIEAIRIFLPALYDLIRSNESKVTGWGNSRRLGTDGSLDAFRSAWVQSLPSEVSDDVQNAMYGLFPGIGGQPGDTNDVLLGWQRDRRICHPDLFHIYFRFSPLPSAVSHGE